AAMKALKSYIALLSLLSCAVFGAQTTRTPSFENDVRPVLAQTCQTCHNERLSSGGLNILPLLEPRSVGSDRETWERIVSRMKAGEMPPKGGERPAPEKIGALVDYIQREFDRADLAGKDAKTDPGRVVVHRLNRSEYANTIRDLFGIDVRAGEEFPPDDSGYG